LELRLSGERATHRAQMPRPVRTRVRRMPSESNCRLRRLLSRKRLGSYMPSYRVAEHGHRRKNDPARSEAIPCQIERPRGTLTCHTLSQCSLAVTSQRSKKSFISPSTLQPRLLSIKDSNPNRMALWRKSFLCASMRDGALAAITSEVGGGNHHKVLQSVHAIELLTAIYTFEVSKGWNGEQVNVDAMASMSSDETRFENTE
jgi:hypothetical protein